MSSRAAFDLVMQELARAKAEHPRFATSLDQTVTVLTSEVGEYATAILAGDIHGPHGAIREVAQVAAVAIRSIEYCLEAENRTCDKCAHDGPGCICEAGHDNEGGCSNCPDWTPKEEARNG